MRTPGIVIFGLVMAPCGWILDLTSTVAASWRTLTSVTGYPTDTVVSQGIWDICTTAAPNTVTCNLRNKDTSYFSNNRVITVAQGMTVAGLVVTLIGLAILTPAARCWQDRPPRWLLVTAAGVLIFLSGVLHLVPIAWYTSVLTALNTTLTFTTTPPPISVGYCIVLGYIGCIMEILGGIVLCVGVRSCCGGRNRGEKPRVRPVERRHRPEPYPRTHEPSVSTRSSSSMSYPRNTRDDDQDFPRAKSRGTVNPSFTGKPYDVDL